MLDSLNDKIDAAYVAEQVLTYAQKKRVALSTIVNNENLSQLNSKFIISPTNIKFNIERSDSDGEILQTPGYLF
jgi:hypothetical protein